MINTVNTQSTIDLAQHIANGHSQTHATELLSVYGKNVLSTKKPPSDFYFFFSQLKNPLIIVLLIASLVTILLQHYTDSIVILLAVFVNTILGFIQERKAFKSLEALKSVVQHLTTVIRDGNKIEIKVEEIVPGDIILLYEGDKIPADGCVMQANDLFVEEAILTGESVPVAKTRAQSFEGNSFSLESIQRLHKSHPDGQKVFMGTSVTSGSAVVLVTNTAMNTQMGEIAKTLGEYTHTPTPLEKKLNILAKHLTIGVLILSFTIFMIGLATNRDPVEMFITSVAVAVAAIPEGLVVGLTAILAIGMNRILKRNGLVKSMTAAETLGSVTTVCVDKTGTLTEGKLQVVSTETDHEELLFIASTVANDHHDPIEIARWKWAQHQFSLNPSLPNPEQLIKKYTRAATIPFSVERRYIAVLCDTEIFIAGAPEEMITACQQTQESLQKIQAQIAQHAKEGKRLLGFGYQKFKTIQKAQAVFDELKKGYPKDDRIQWLGLMAFYDPVRPTVSDTIAKAQQAGISIKIITGDYRATAISVLEKIGISVPDSQILEGVDIEDLTSTQLQEKVRNTVLFARTKPSQKFRIVQALQANKEIVAMMGDGVNDAPALIASDIGIVVENASEIAKEAADLILLDSNMQTIIDAIEEGRSMFNNLRKVILYLLSDSFAEILLILFSVLFGVPLAITAVQILWVNLIDDGLPSLALTIDPKDDHLLKRKPLSPQTPLINKEMLGLIMLISSITALACFLIFTQLVQVREPQYAQTVVFAILSIESLLYIFSCRSLEKSVWEIPFFNNIPLLLACGFGVVLTILSVHVPILQKLLGTVSLPIQEWQLIFVVCGMITILIETFKWVWKKIYSPRLLSKTF